MPRLRAQRPTASLPSPRSHRWGEDRKGEGRGATLATTPRKSQATGPVQWFIWYLNKRALLSRAPSRDPLRLFMGKDASVNYMDEYALQFFNTTPRISLAIFITEYLLLDVGEMVIYIYIYIYIYVCISQA